MKTKDVEKLYAEYILPTYKQNGICLVKGKGARVWDLEQREYLDFFPGWAVSGLGHCHPAVVNALKTQSRKILHISNNFLNIKQAELARELVKNSFPAKVFFCNSGAEALDGAVKVARKFGAASGRYEVITLKKSFHGRNFAGIAATGQDKVKEGFQPMLEGFRYADMNDLESVREQVTAKTAAILLEPVQGEGGVSTATQDFMKGLRRLCDEKNLLLMVDEVQTGMGRTGRMFAYQHYGIEPDVMTLAKSLGSGVPIGAFLVHNRLGALMGPGSHGCTYGGNPLVCAAGLAVFKAIKKGGLIEKTKKLGEYFGTQLEALKKRHPQILEIRGLALMRGLALSVPGAPIVERAAKKGLLINCTQDTVLRIMPPLIVTRKQIDRALYILEQALPESR